jgi:hypothetical protein
MRKSLGAVCPELPSNWRSMERSHQIIRVLWSRYGEIKRTGTGEVPDPPTTGAALLLDELQPAMLSTVMLLSPSVGEGGKSPG